MSDRPFTPLWLNLPAGPRQVSSAYEGLECLEAAWPIVSGNAFRWAIQRAYDALDGFVSAECARAALLRAAEEAGLVKFKRTPKRLAENTLRTASIEASRISAPDDRV